MSVIVQTTPVIFLQSPSPPLPRGIPSYSREFSFMKNERIWKSQNCFKTVFFLILFLAFNDIKLVVLSYFA